MIRGRRSPEKTQFARRLRQHPTATERALWHCLRREQLGVRFRRQAQVFGWIADFYCPSRKLVIEIDGYSHIGREHEDRRRDTALRRYGYRTLRVPAVEVYRKLPAVVRRIREALDA